MKHDVALLVRPCAIFACVGCRFVQHQRKGHDAMSVNRDRRASQVDASVVSLGEWTQGTIDLVERRYLPIQCGQQRLRFRHYHQALFEPLPGLGFTEFPQRHRDDRLNHGECVFYPVLQLFHDQIAHCFRLVPARDVERRAQYL